jgi:diguanylate cyclase (GGDEF)-like protein
MRGALACGRGDPFMRLATLIPRRQAFLAAGAVTYATVFALFLIFERPGLGVGHGFYLAVIFVSLARGPIVAVAAGLLATVLYAIGIWINPHVSPATIPTLATSIRGITYIAVGLVVGWYASRNRTLNRRLVELTSQLQMLADRDVLTGLPNTRAFEPAITRRIDNEETFALLLADVDGLKRINTANGYDEGNDLLRNVAERLTHKLPPNSDIARVGDDEFAILIPCTKAEAAARQATQLQAYLDLNDSRVIFGWAMHPREGTNALALYRVADERLYARKLMRGQRRGILELVEDPPAAQANPEALS